jgi:hypothetical protein
MALTLALGGVVWSGAASYLWAQTNSRVRIVRLSFAEGTVSVERPDVTGWTTAPVNTPIQEGFKLSTGKDSFAEVEFENGSTARIGELSLLEFTELSLAPSGGKVNRLAFSQGYATFHLTPGLDDVYEVNVAQAKLTPNGKAEFRADLDGDRLRVEVFTGAVEFSGPKGSVMLAKNKVLETSLTTEEAYQVTHGITKDSWDEWVAERDDVLASDRAPSVYSSQAAGANYGWADLYDYGDWSYLPGYGYGWTPAMYGGWSPFSLGRWCWYPGFGYTWISYEPWGWLPYHYGGWVFDPTFGWAWFPGAFGTWFPAQVTWYQGPGWIGWAPLTPPVQPAGGKPTAGNPRGPRGCPGGGSCIKGVPVQSLASGKLITPSGLMSVDVAKAQQISNPDVAPTTEARLTGIPLPAASARQETFERGAEAFSDLGRSAPSALATSGGGGRGRPRPTFTHSALFSGRGSSNLGFGVASRPAPIQRARHPLAGFGPAAALAPPPHTAWAGASPPALPRVVSAAEAHTAVASVVTVEFEKSIRHTVYGKPGCRVPPSSSSPRRLCTACRILPLFFP